MTPDQKKTLKKQRLEQYEKQMFILEMDITALQAVGDDVTEASKSLEDLKKAHAAVEAM